MVTSTNSPAVHCAPRLEGINCQTDIDECVRGTHTCDTNAACLNTQGGYSCVCYTGFSGDGHSCVEDNSPTAHYYVTSGKLNCKPGMDVPFGPGVPGWYDDPTSFFSVRRIRNSVS